MQNQLTAQTTPLMPTPAPSIEQLLSSRYSEEKEFWTPPLKATLLQVQDATTFCRSVEAVFPPANPEHLKDRLSGLLAHFFIHQIKESMGEKVLAIVAHDWMHILAPFPLACVEKACRKWLETQDRKPKPVDIRELAIDAFGRKLWQQRERAKQIAAMTPTAAPDKPKEEEWVPPTEEQKRKVAEMLRNAGIGAIRETVI